MARLPLIEQRQLPPEQQPLLSANINIHKLLANSPEALSYFRALTTYVRDESAIDPRLRELAIMQIGYAAKRPYIYTHHIKIGLALGIPPDDIRAIADETAGRKSSLEPLAKAVLKAARELTLGIGVSSRTYEELQGNLSSRELIDLCMSIIAYTSTLRFLETFAVELEPQYEHFLSDYPIE